MNDKSFAEWEKYIQSTGIPATNESRLAIQTLKICIADNNIDDEFEQPKILNNGFALFDYTMYCYFVFRARLCQSFDRAFVELYDAYIQKLMSLYFYRFFDIPEKNIDRLISLRAIAYDEIVAANPENILTETVNLLCIFINNDFDNMPESDNLVISSIFVYYELYAKLSSYLPITMNSLDKQAELFELLENSKNAQNVKNSTTSEIKVNHENAQRVIKQYEQKNNYLNNSKQFNETTKKKRNVLTKLKTIIKKDKKVYKRGMEVEYKNSDSNQTNSVKERLLSSLGCGWILLYYLVRIIVAVLPFLMIDANFFVNVLLIGINMLVPFASVFFWIWGLVCAVNGIQDVWAILYYIVFVVVWIPFYINLIVSFISDRKR